MKTFEDVFNGEPEARAEAPGRVNLLGEHTDYNEGFVLPTAIPQRTHVALRRITGEVFSVYSANLARTASFTLEAPPPQRFASYVYGCVRGVTEATSTPVPPLELHVASEVPIGVGLSSSAALEIATLRALRSLLHLDLDDVRLAQLAQRAEIDYAGVNCGILDQMASSLLHPGVMLFLDTRSLERRLLPLPGGAEILVIDSGISRALASSAYNERRAECEAAARALGVAALRDVSDARAVEPLPEPLRRRARHVVTENARVITASQGVDARAFGALMSASHRSLRDDYEVSVPALDELVAQLEAQLDVYGAKLTGAGFGGACVALCRAGCARNVAERTVRMDLRRAPARRRLVPPR
ncbi:MAG: galactokinase [Burkholderiales bacterium]